jgi:hypothetical protein
VAAAATRARTRRVVALRSGAGGCRCRRSDYRGSRAHDGHRVQAFNALAVHGGGVPVLPLETLFNGVAEQPTAPEYWWLYAPLLSTMIPSLVNLVIGGASLGARAAWTAVAASAENTGLEQRAQILPRLDRHCLDRPDRGGRSPRDRGASAPGRSRHRLRHAVLWPGVARHGRRRCSFQFAGSGGAALRGELVGTAGSRDSASPRPASEPPSP